jgi:hypothetical protein
MLILPCSHEDRRRYDDVHPHGRAASADGYVVTSAGMYIPATPEQLTTAALQLGVRVHLMSGCSLPLVVALRRCSASSAALRYRPSCVGRPGGAGATLIDAERAFTYFT